MPSTQTPYEGAPKAVVIIAPIRTDRDYDAALKEIEGLMDATARTPEGDRLDVLVTLVEAYEARRWAK